MATKPQNHGKPWTQPDVCKLEKLADGNTPTRIIALKMGRTEDSIQFKVRHLQRILV